METPGSLRDRPPQHTSPSPHTLAPAAGVADLAWGSVRSGFWCTRWLVKRHVFVSIMEDHMAKKYVVKLMQEARVARIKLKRLYPKLMA